MARHGRPVAAVHPADEYALYQSLVRRPPQLAPDDESGLLTLQDRLQGWLIKALREGKERSDWNDPDHEYEGRALSFLREALQPACPFVAALSGFVRRLEPAAAANSLAQLLVKLTAPGIPDLAQGAGARFQPSRSRQSAACRFRGSGTRPGGRVASEAESLRRALALRARRPDLFARGRYHPLAVEGDLPATCLRSGAC